MRHQSSLLLVLVVAGLFGQNVSRSGIHPEDMDTTCKPCTDFRRYVNGGWLDKSPIPVDQAYWGAFGVLRAANRERIRTILEAAAADSGAAPGTDRRKLGDLYASCMDTAAIDARGLAPLEADFDRIAAIQSIRELGAMLSSFQRVVEVGPFGLYSVQDLKDPERVVALLDPSDAILSLPERDYYFRDDEKSRQTRAAFLEHATRMLELAGTPHAAAEEQAKAVLSFETVLAESVMTVAESRDPEKTYHPMDLAGVRALAPNFDWAQLFREAGIPETTTSDVTEPEVLKKINRQITTVPLDAWKVWLRWRALKVSAPYLSKSIADESFHFESTHTQRH